MRTVEMPSGAVTRPAGSQFRSQGNFLWPSLGFCEGSRRKSLPTACIVVEHGVDLLSRLADEECPSPGLDCIDQPGAMPAQDLRQKDMAAVICGVWIQEGKIFSSHTSVTG